MSLKSDFIYFFFHDLIYVYSSPRTGGIQSPRDKVLMSTETSCHFGYLLLVSDHRRQNSETSIVLLFIPYKSIRDQNWPCLKKGQGQPRVIIWSNLVVFEHPMMHNKFQGHRPFGSRVEDFLSFLPYMGMPAILVMWPGPFEQNFCSCIP